MSIGPILSGNDVELELRHLRVFEVLLREQNLTRAAQALDVTQPSISKTLAHLRLYFSDPLFVRVGSGVAPTAKALELEPAVRALLDQVTSLHARHVPFDAESSKRMFRVCVFDAGVIRLLPPLIRLMQDRAPKVRLTIVPLGHDDIEAALETGELDLVVGSYVSLTKRVRRQRLFAASYTSAVREGHQRLDTVPSREAFAAEKHVLVSASGTAHTHQRTERAIERLVPEENIICRVPTFLTAAAVAAMTDAVATLPSKVAEPLVERMQLKLIAPPLKLPRIEVSQYWHQRFHREPGNRWLRDALVQLFTERDR